MADTTLELNTGSGGGKLAVDASGSTLYQYVKLTFGASGTQTPITGAAPLPVYLAGAPSLTHTMVVTGSAGGAVVVDGSGVTQPVSGTVTVQDGGGAITVDGTVAVTNGVIASLSSSYTVAAIKGALPAGDNNIGNVDIVTLPASTNTIEVVGDAAHDAAVAGNPLLQGFEARTTNPTAVANGDAVRGMADDLGRQVIMPMAPRDLVTQLHVSLSVSTTTTLLPAAGASVFTDLLMLTISNPSSTAATVTIFDGHTTGTQAFKWEFAADGGGITLTFPAPYKNGTANTGWGITSTELGVTATVQAINTV